MRLFFLLFLSCLVCSCGSLDLNDLESQLDKDKQQHRDDDLSRKDTCYIFDGKHVAIFYDRISNTEVNVTLLSLAQWHELPSALSKTNPNRCQTLRDYYLEHDLDGWSIPTVEQAQRLKSAFGSDENRLSRLDALVQTLDSEPFLFTHGGESARYLCDEGKKSFGLSPKTTISTAGTTTNKYILRLLKTITLTL